MENDLGPVMVWTKYGLMPEAQLTYSHKWDDTEDYVAFTETYTNADGEIVKQSQHVLGKKPFPLTESVQGSING